MQHGSELIGALGLSWHGSDLKCFSSWGKDQITCRKRCRYHLPPVRSTSVMTEPTLFKKVSEIGAASGWSDVMLCHSKKVNGREIVACFCFQMGH